MPVKENVFVPFRLLSPSDPEYKADCPAKTGNGSRCKSRLQKCNIPQINELLAKLQDSHENTIEDETREDTLREIARLSICGHQKKSIEAAVRQWIAEIQSQASHSVGLRTPPRNVNAQLKDNGGGSKLEFTPYRRKEIETVANELSRKLDLIMDENISVELLKHIGDWKAERGHLYVFECEGAEGMYKVGRTTRVRKRGAEQEKCYPRLVERRSIYCPNAELFERLVHLEFAQHRYQHKCVHCNQTHTEWFKTPYDDIVGRILLWSRFSQDLQSGDTFAKLSQVTIPLPGASSDPDRWYRWVLKWVELWTEKSPVPESNPSEESVVNKTNGIEDLEPDEDAAWGPGLSPSSSGPGIPGDDFTDPPTPTPSVRTRKGKFTMREPLIIPEVIPSESNDVFWTPVEDVSNMSSTPTPKGPVRFAGVTRELPVRQKGP
ncbi:T5orf172 domain-containing protein [Aspergillus cavernicola]|uniref:T5orf172 domain-containing protein n=1 Tax=Aspergillus cavernicola TaxID=176166 RepID=A0ABR4J176_9EURO